MKLYCHKCGGHKNHNIIAKEEFQSDPNHGEIWGENHYFSRCAGCDSITYSVASWDEFGWDPNTGKMGYEWKTYPRGPGDRNPMDEYWDLPAKIRKIYLEVIKAANAQLNILTAIGLRALIEAICKERKVSGDNLEQLIDGLANSGILSKDQAKILHGHRFLGNIAAHEVVSADPREIIAALEIAETMLRTIYILPELSKTITTGSKSP